MRVLIATDSFKVSLDAATACAAIARGVRRVDPQRRLDSCRSPTAAKAPRR